VYHVRASLDPTAEAIRHYDADNLLGGAPEQDHRLVWRLFGAIGASRDFVFRVVGRKPFSVEAVAARRPVPDAPFWSLSVRPVDEAYSPGDVFDLSTNAILIRSDRPSGSRKRGAKHDLVSAAVHALRAGRPDPETAHLPPDAGRHEVVVPASLSWMSRAAPRLGFDLVPGNEGTPLFHAEVSPTSTDARRPAPKGIPALRAIDIRARVRVTDTEAFATMARNGIGHGKGYGYGMVALSRVGSI